MNSHLATPALAETPQSDHFVDGRFINPEPVSLRSFKKTVQIFSRFITEKRVNTTPAKRIPVYPVQREMLEALPDNTLHLVKLGHSSILLKVYGEFWLIDPVLSERASPFSFMGPKRFHPTPIDVDDLPDIDRVLISHNHYDHLDKSTVRKLAQKTREFSVPLGVDALLIKWGVDQKKISSFDWWQHQPTANGFIAFTPTRHFSGRAMTDGDRTLWGSWVIGTAHERLYFSGDSGYFAGFKDIGEKYGPFDLTFIETGAYDQDWPDVHMTPEQSVQAHQDVRGKVMVPIHNGTFDLAFHSWYDPMERVSQAAQEQKVTLSTPVFGEIKTLETLSNTYPWWRDVMQAE